MSGSQNGSLTTKQMLEDVERPMCTFVFMYVNRMIKVITSFCHSKTSNAEWDDYNPVFAVKSDTHCMYLLCSDHCSAS